MFLFSFLFFFFFFFCSLHHVKKSMWLRPWQIPLYVRRRDVCQVIHYFLISAPDLECDCLLELPKWGFSDGTCSLCLGWGWEEYHHFPSEIHHLKAIKIWLFCIDVVVWCFCFLLIVAFAPVYTCPFITCLCLSVCILCSYATCVWPEFIFYKVLFC